MRKDISGLVAMLKTSVIEIGNSPADDREALMGKSIGEFEAALMEKLDPVMPVFDEPLAKGLNHIAMFANTLRDCGRTIEAIRTGRPSYLSGDSSMPPEQATPDTLRALDRFLSVGMLTLAGMVTSEASMPESDEELERAERNGDLVKIEDFEGQEVGLIVPGLPDMLKVYVTDPVHLMIDYADIGRDFTGEARELGKALSEAELVPVELAKTYDELFKLEDETSGTGGDPDAAIDPGDDSNAGMQDDDPPQNRWETIARMAAVIMVLCNDALQAGAPDGTEGLDETGGDVSGIPDDNLAMANKRAPVVDIGDVELTKIETGEVAVHDTVADALIELHDLRKRVADLTKDKGDLAKNHTAVENELDTLRKTLARLQSAPAAPKGAVMALGKAEDTTLPAANGGRTPEALAELAKSDPDAAAKELLKMVHRGGGTPVVPA